MDKRCVSRARLIKMVGRPGHIPPRDYELVCRDGRPRCEVRFTVSSTGCHSALSCAVSLGGTQGDAALVTSAASREQRPAGTTTDLPETSMWALPAQTKGHMGGCLNFFFFALFFEERLLFRLGAQPGAAELNSFLHVPCWEL